MKKSKGLILGLIILLVMGAVSLTSCSGECEGCKVTTIYGTTTVLEYELCGHSRCSLCKFARNPSGHTQVPPCDCP